MVGGRCHVAPGHRGAGGVVLPAEDGVPAPLDIAEEEARARVAEQIRAAPDAPAGEVCAGIPVARTLLRVIDIPDAPPEEMRDIAALQMEKFSPFPTEQMSVSYEILAVQEGTARVLLAAAPLDLLERLRATLAAAKMDAERIDVNLLGWWRLAQDSGRARHAGRQILLFLHDGECDLIATQATVPVLFRGLGPRSAQSPEDAAAIAREVAQSLLAIEAEYGPSVIAPATVWHEDAGAPAALLAALRTDCGLETETAPLRDLGTVSRGLALRTSAVGALDLTPAAWREAEQARFAKRRIISMSLGAAAVWLVLVGGLFGGLKVQQYRLDRQEKSKTDLDAKAEEVRTMRRRSAELEQYTNRTHSALETFLEIINLQPAEVTLTSFTYKKAKNVMITGEAESANPVFQYKLALDASPLFGKIDLSGPNPNQRTKKEDFRMTADLVAPKGEVRGAAPP